MVNVFTISLVCVVVSGVCYGGVVLLLFTACRKVRNGISKKQPFITVIVAARDERPVIGTCLASLMNQNYPLELYEVIVVDDRSTDATEEVLKRFLEIWQNFSYIRINTVPDGLSSKKHALNSAINKARGEIILQTDADCVVRPGWLAGMAERFEDGVDMVAGIAPYKKTSGALNSFICHEYNWNVFLSAGSILLGSGTHASARNLGFRREAFMAVEGYGESARITSGDDTLLLHRIQKRNPRSVVTLPDHKTHIFTRSPDDFTTFLRQRTRHMSTGRYFSPLQIMTGCIIYGFQLLILLSFLYAFFSYAFFWITLVALLVKAGIDMLIARTATHMFGLTVHWKNYIINELWMILYMSFMPLAGIIIPVKWKENS